jgi:very-short-patch-repair endonuclease
MRAMHPSRQRVPVSFLAPLGRLRTLVESIGPPVWSSGATSAALMSCDGFNLAEPFHLAVERGRSVQRRDHFVHRLRDVERLDTTVVFGIPTLSGTRVLIELAATLPADRLTVALDSMLRDGWTSEEFLHRRIVELHRKGRIGLGKLLDVMQGSERTRGGHSFLERAFLTLLDELELPRPRTQQVLGRRGRQAIRVDCWFQGTNIVVELLGYGFHRSQMQMQADAERLNELQMNGFLVVQFTYTDVVTRSQRMLDLLAELFPPSLKPRRRSSGHSQKRT